MLGLHLDAGFYLAGIYHSCTDRRLPEDDVRTKYLAAATAVESCGRSARAQRAAAVAARARWARELGRRGLAAQITASGEVRLGVGFVGHAQFFVMTGTTLTTGAGCVSM